MIKPLKLRRSFAMQFGTSSKASLTQRKSERTCGNHLDTQGCTIDDNLEKKNFQFAGEALAEVWSEMVIDGESVIAEYISPDEIVPDSGSLPGPEWNAKHVMESQYMLQISKCSNLLCCSKPRSKLRKILPDGFLPPPVLLTSSLEVSPPLGENASFCPLYLQLALKVQVSLGDFKKLPYDFYCPTLQDELLQRCCSLCGDYFASQISMKQHKKSVHSHQISVQNTGSSSSTSASLRRSARVLGRQGNEVLHLVNDSVTGQELDVEWAEVDEDELSLTGEPVANPMPMIQSFEEWVKSPWENIK